MRMNVTMFLPVVRRLLAIMKDRGFGERSECLSTLIREEYERRGKPPLSG
jgi:metal-responsive CopG/Arc/MetJ family transcriptional regulator